MLTMEDNEQEKNKSRIFENVLEKRNIIVYIIAFMISMVGIGGEFSIFSFSLLGACIASSVPILGVVIASIIGNLIHFGIGGMVEYVVTTLVLLVTLFVIKPRYNEHQKNENIKIGTNIFIAMCIVQITKICMHTFTMYDVFSSILLIIIAFVFYKIFVNSISGIQELNQQKAYTIEEVIGSSLMLAIASGALGDFSIWGVNIRNILSILIVMVLGWKNGMLVGATSGITIGVTLGVITNSEPIMIAAYAISGMIAGLLNRFGKIGVVVGFALGNVVFAYVTNGYTTELIHFKEILIASIGLLLLPKTFRIDIEEFIPKQTLLPIASDRTLNKSREVVENLNNVSNVIQEMVTNNDIINKSQENIHIFMVELLNNLEPYKNNMFYDDMLDSNGKIIQNIFVTLTDKQEINKEDFLQIYAKSNNFIAGFDDKETSKYLDENISQIIRMINLSYNVAKSKFVLMKKTEENEKNVNKQLNNVSKAIKNIAKGIESDIENESKYEKEKMQILELMRQKEILIEDVSIRKNERYFVEVYTSAIVEMSMIQTLEKIISKVLKEEIVCNTETSINNRLDFMSCDKYEMSIGTSVATKTKSDESGDSILNIRLKDGKYLVAISDGMGTGKEAKKSSQRVLKLLEDLLQTGFDKNLSLELINTALLNQKDEIYATLDIAIIDMYEGTIEFIKSGACPTYIKNKNKVQIIKSNTLPTGIMENVDIQSFDKDIVSGDILVMCTDGIIDSNVEFKNKDLWLKYALEDMESNNTTKIASLILNESIDNNFGMVKDDMSVVVCKFIKKNK